MLFVIDIGNSHTVVGLYDGEDLRGQWRLKSDRAMTPDEIAIQFNALFAMAGIVDLAITDIISVITCNQNRLLSATQPLHL